jgi:hypothetical protein
MECASIRQTRWVSVNLPYNFPHNFSGPHLCLARADRMSAIGLIGGGEEEGPYAKVKSRIQGSGTTPEVGETRKRLRPEGTRRNFRESQTVKL